MRKCWLKNVATFEKKLKLENGFQKQSKGVHCVDLGESFHMSIYHLLPKFGFKQQDEPAHPAEANDAEVCEKIDSIIGLKPEPPAEEPGNASMREPHGKGAAKPRKKLQKRPRSFWHDGKHHIVK